MIYIYIYIYVCVGVRYGSENTSWSSVLDFISKHSCSLCGISPLFARYSSWVPRRVAEDDADGLKLLSLFEALVVRFRAKFLSLS